MTRALAILLTVLGTLSFQAYSQDQETDGGLSTSTEPANITIDFPSVNSVSGPSVTLALPLNPTVAESFPFVRPSASNSPSTTPSASPTPSPSSSPSTSPSPSPSPSASSTGYPSPSINPSSSPSPEISDAGNSNTDPPSTESVSIDSQNSASSRLPSPIPFLSSSPSPSCPANCECKDSGELLGEESFDESELQKFADNSGSIFIAPDWPSGPVFRNEWDPALTVYDGNELTLTVEKTPSGDLNGAAIRTNTHWYGYGCVSACMKPIKVSGIISSLFTYTGKLDGANGNQLNQNEIDIEFEGQDTTVVQFNYYTDKADDDPQQFNEMDYNLGFDASESYNVYGFRWTPWGIEWVVNGLVAKKVTQDDSPPPPVVTADTVQKVMANAWIVPEDTAPYFGGPFDEANFDRARAAYKWIRYDKLDSNGCCTISATC